jgi:cytochrome P450
VNDPDLLTAEALRDPYPLLAGMRERDPVSFSERYGGWMITGYEACSAAHTDRRISSDRVGPALRRLQEQGGDERLLATLQVLADWMVFKDGREHRRLRDLVQRAFTPRTVARMRQRVVQITDELLDALPGGGEVDLVAHFAGPLPATVIADMLGAPTSDRDRFRAWSQDLVSLVFAGHGDEGRHARAAAGMAELVASLEALVARKRAEPGEDLVSLVVGADVGEDALGDHEVVAMCTLLLFAGSETTANLIASGLLGLLRHPDQLERLRGQPALAPSAVEELLRYDGPARMSPRVVADELDLHGHTLRRGERAYLVLAAANRDPEQFAAPDALDIGREPNAHLGFGLGRHYCLGASLARLEAAIVIPRVLERLPDLALAREQLDYAPFLISRALTALPVRVG